MNVQFYVNNEAAQDLVQLKIPFTHLGEYIKFNHDVEDDIVYDLLPDGVIEHIGLNCEYLIHAVY